jgi:hypothetical protein
LPLRIVVLIMAVSFIITTVLGVVIAFKTGRSQKAAFYCLLAGIASPGVLVLLRMWATAP